MSDAWAKAVAAWAGAAGFVGATWAVCWCFVALARAMCREDAEGNEQEGGAE